jgi:hypothetical protein
VLVVLGWVVTPTPVPIYDGLGVPDEPYRYVDGAGRGRATQPPTTATAQTPVRKGSSAMDLVISSREQGPQVTLFLPAGSLVAADFSEITVRVLPQAPESQLSSLKISGNVYRVELSASDGRVTLGSNIASSNIFLRATDQRDGWHMLYRPDAGGWQPPLKARRPGTDTWVARFQGPGDYALARSELPAASASQLPWVLAGVLGLLALVIVIVRLSGNGSPGLEASTKQDVHGHDT